MVYNTYLIMTDPIKHLNKVSGRRFFLITLSQREGVRREVRRRGRLVQFAISSPTHYRLVRMYINILNIWTTYDKFNSVSNINNKDIKWVCRVIYNTHTQSHTLLSDKENEQIEQEV